MSSTFHIQPCPHLSHGVQAHCQQHPRRIRQSMPSDPHWCVSPRTCCHSHQMERSLHKASKEMLLTLQAKRRPTSSVYLSSAPPNQKTAHPKAHVLRHARDQCTSTYYVIRVAADNADQNAGQTAVRRKVIFDVTHATLKQIAVTSMLFEVERVALTNNAISSRGCDRCDRFSPLCVLCTLTRPESMLHCRATAPK